MRRPFSFIAALMIPAASAILAGAQNKNEELFYIINYSVSHCDAEIELNGITMTRSEKKTQYTVTGLSDVSMWICPGANTVTVTIRPIAKQKDLITKPSILLSVSTAKEGQMSDEGKKIIMTVHRSGEFFGELSLIDGKTAPATILTTKDSVIAIISKNVFYSLLLSQNKVLENLLHILSSRLREAWKKIQLLNFNNASQRIKMLLLMLSEDYGKKTPPFD